MGIQINGNNDIISALDGSWTAEGASINTSGILTATTFTGNVTGTACTFVDGKFTGNVTVGGTLTYEDVTNIDSVGLVTARDGVFIPDNKELKIGNTAGTPDLKIYHSSSDNNSYIKESGTGSLFVTASRFEVSNAAGTEALINAVQDSGVKLYDGTNTVRLETTSSGATVTGTLTATTFSGTLNGAVTTTDACQVGDLTILNGNPDLRLKDSNHGGNNTEHMIAFQDSSGNNQMNIGSPFGEQHLRIKHGANELVKIQTDGKVGIGTVSPSFFTHIQGDGVSNDVLKITANGSGQMVNIRNHSNVPSIVRFANYLGNSFWDVQYNTDNSFALDYQDSEKFRIDSTGRLIVGSGTNTIVNAFKAAIKETSGENAAIVFLDTDNMKGGICGIAKGTDQIITGTSNVDFIVGSSYNKTHIITGNGSNSTGYIRATFDQNGHFGIGRSSSLQLLDVKGVNDDAIKLSASDYGGGHLRITGEDRTPSGTAGPYGHTIRFKTKPQNNNAGNGAERDALIFYHEGWSGLHVASFPSGKVGINETNPDAPLHITGGLPHIRLENSGTSASAGDTFGQIDFKHNDSNDPGVTASIKCVAEDNAGNSYLTINNANGGNDTERLRITSGGEVLIGGRSNWGGGNLHPNTVNKLVITGPSPANVYNNILYLEGSETNGNANTGGALAFGGHDGSQYRNWGNIYCMKENGSGGNRASYMSFHTRVSGGDPAEKLRIRSDSSMLHTRTDNTGRYDLEFRQTGGISDGNYGGIKWTQNSSGGTFLGSICMLYSGTGRPDMVFYQRDRGGSNGSDEGFRLTRDGNLTTCETHTFSRANAGFTARKGDSVSITRNNGTPVEINRTGNDGWVVLIYQAGSNEGGISVSGSSVSYNGGVLTRWSQLVGISTNNKADRPSIYNGTVMSNLDEMCEWIGEENMQLNKTQVSTASGDKNVAGVFWGWDDDDDNYTNDFFVAQTGDYIIRVGAATTVTRGDLLESAGDGTAKPQSDDIVRSKTIAKVTSGIAHTTYADGSKTYPCVLMAS